MLELSKVRNSALLREDNRSPQLASGMEEKVSSAAAQHDEHILRRAGRSDATTDVDDPTAIRRRSP